MINIQPPPNITKIYLVENCYGDPNKIYIGKTKNCRFYRHKIKFGKQIKYTIIDEINSIDSKDWKPLECYWIEQFKSWGFDLQNKNDGGTGSSFLSQETKEKISRKKKGIPNSNKSRNKGRKISDEENRKRSISLTGNIKSQKTKDKISKTRKLNKCGQIPIVQYNLEGNFIKEWPSITEAVKKYNKGIPSALSGRQHTSFGFIWKYKN